jgi:fibronectin type 3 domain-containing protein
MLGPAFANHLAMSTSESGNAAGAAILVAPPAPERVTATQDLPDKVDVRWDPSQGAAAYEVWRGTSDREEEAEKVAKTSEPSWDDTKAAQDVIYVYWIKARNAAGVSGWSPSASGQRPLTVEARLSDLQGQVDELNRQLEKRRAATPNHPEVRALQRRLKSAQEKLATAQVDLHRELFVKLLDRFAKSSKEIEDHLQVFKPENKGQRLKAYNLYKALCGAEDAIKRFAVDPESELGTPPRTKGAWLADVNERLQRTEERLVEFEVVDYEEGVRPLRPHGGGSPPPPPPPPGPAQEPARATAAVSTGPAPVTPSGPPAPGMVKATEDLEDVVFLTWSPSQGAEAYEVFRGAEEVEGAAARIAEVTVASFEDASPAAGVRQYYRVRARGRSGLSPFSAVASGIRKARAILPPMGVQTMDDSPDGVRLRWLASRGASSYEVWRGNTERSEGAVRLGETVGNEYLDATCAAGQVGYYWVKAKTSFGVSTFSERVRGVRKPAAPAAPGAISASTDWRDGIRLSWPPCASAELYEIWRGQVTEESGLRLLAESLAPSYEDRSASEGMAWFYRVKAKAGSGVSGFSAAAQGLRPVAPPAPSAKVTASTDSDSRVRLAWTPSPGATSYEVWTGPSLAGGPTRKLAEASQPVFDDETAEPGLERWYWIKTRRGELASSFSLPVRGLRKEPPAPPAGKLRIPPGCLGSAEPGTHLLLLPVSGNFKSTFRLVARDQFYLGRNREQVDLATWFWPRSEANDSRTRQISKRHAVAGWQEQQWPAVRDLGHLEDDRTEPNGATLNDQPLAVEVWERIKGRGILRLGPEYVMEVTHYTAHYSGSPEVINAAQWRGPAGGKPRAGGAVRFQPMNTKLPDWAAVWLLSDGTFGSSTANPIVLQGPGIIDVHGRFHFWRDCFWVENLGATALIRVGELETRTGDFVPLTSAQTLQLGEVVFQVEIGSTPPKGGGGS